MCGRYSITTAPEAFFRRRLTSTQPRYNVAPTQPAPVVRIDEGGKRALGYMQWGLVPSWAKEVSIGAKMINARSETVTEKPAFRAAVRRRRCLVPADGFYEWRTEAGGKQPYRVVRKDRGPFAFAGLWEVWEGSGEGSWLETFTVLTTEANAAIRDIHHRMPVMLFEEDAFETWLSGNLSAAMMLAQPCDASEIEAYPVDKRVGNVSNDDPSLFDALEAAGPQTTADAPPQQGSLF